MKVSRGGKFNQGKVDRRLYLEESKVKEAPRSKIFHVPFLYRNGEIPDCHFFFPYHYF